LQKLPAESVNCIVTSPPYYALRDYGVDGQIGLEKSPEKYIENLVNVFMECHRVLKNDGTFWLNIGDSYAGSMKGKGHNKPSGIQPKASWVGEKITTFNLKGYKNKDLIGVPWALAFALRERGWYLRQDIIWHKPNPMPESVTDRCTKAHEYIFMFSKSPKYYFDKTAILEPAKYDNRKKLEKSPSKKYLQDGTGLAVQGLSKGGYRWQDIEGKFMRNKRDVWCVPTKPLKEAHFAAYPPDLIRPCIAAGCPEGGIVLDPFMGAGTTALVARECYRNYIGIELNAEYVKIAEGRLANF
jgi:DNA modification methylase